MITKQALGNTLFGMADILRDKVEDYKSYILSLLFFKRLSDNYKWEIEHGIQDFKNEYGVEPNQKQKQKIINDKHDFIIPEDCFWENVRKASLDRKNSALNKAVNAIADVNIALKGIINTVRWNEPSPDGSGGKRLHPEVLSLLVNYLDAVDLSNQNASVDVLGDSYEYLIKRFADENKGGTTAGQFYTPQEVVDVIVSYLKPQKGCSLYDPTCGSGGFLINAAKYIKRNTGKQKNIRLFGQEDVWNTWAISNINMILHGLDASIKKGDTIKDPKFTEVDDPLAIKTFDFVMANFPFSQENWWKNGEPEKDKKGRAVTKKDGSPKINYPGKADFNEPYERFDYGIPPFSNGDYAFLQHIVASMNEDGKAGVVCPQGVLFRGQPEKTKEEDGQNRKADDEYLIRRGFLQGSVNKDGEFVQGINIIDAIVFLPENLFYGTTIPGAIVFFNKNKPKERKDKVLMVYAAKEGWYKEEPNMNVLLPQDILRISTILESWGDIETSKEWIASQKTHLRTLIQEDLDFKKEEIELDTQEDIELAQEKLKKAEEVISAKKAEGKKPTQGQLNNLQKVKGALEKTIVLKKKRLADKEDHAEKERVAIDEVENELLIMLADPILRKRYFSVVDMEELEENEFNLNIPRYVDTFEPEEEIDLKEAVEGYKASLKAENSIDELLAKLLDVENVVDESPSELVETIL
ncbi:MAG: N-6 DNA methylase [Candidatus Theseobacter exili]|nr:N-6 DNA methylase [Candidatus Theseobacter exili]